MNKETFKKIHSAIRGAKRQGNVSLPFSVSRSFLGRDLKGFQGVTRKDFEAVEKTLEPLLGWTAQARAEQRKASSCHRELVHEAGKYWFI